MLGEVKVFEQVEARQALYRVSVITYVFFSLIISYAALLLKLLVYED